MKSFLKNLFIFCPIRLDVFKKVLSSFWGELLLSIGFYLVKIPLEYIQ